MDAPGPAIGCRRRPAGQSPPVLLPRPASAAPRTSERTASELVDQVSADTYRALVEELTAHPTRHSFTEAYRTAARSAGDRFAALGYLTRSEPVVVAGRGAAGRMAARDHSASSMGRSIRASS
jgi:predicted flavoprotein YhiN